jgi:hypothetical protein
MKTIKFVGYLLHRYYSKGSRANIAYFSTMCTMTFLGFMHLMQMLILLDKSDFIPINFNDNKLAKRIIIFFTMLPIYFLMTRLIKKSDIEPLKEKYNYNWDKVFSANIFLVIYVALSFTLIIVLALWKKN